MARTWAVTRFLELKGNIQPNDNINYALCDLIVLTEENVERNDVGKLDPVRCVPRECTSQPTASPGGGRRGRAAGPRWPALWQHTAVGRSPVAFT